MLPGGAKPSRGARRLAANPLTTALLVAGALVACSDQGTSEGNASAQAGATGSLGGSGAAGASGGSVGGAGASSAGTAGTAAGMGGSTSTAGSAGGGSAGEGTAGGGAGGAVAGNAGTGGAAGTAGAAACAPGAILCDDFESYDEGATDLNPTWSAYTYSGALQVDASKPHAGQRSLHLTVQAGAHHYADLIRETPNVELVPLKHYGRMMVWIDAIPDQSHWNLNSSSGPMMGAPDELSKFLEGGMFGKLMSNYAQRGRIKDGDTYPLRGGGPETGDPGADSDCAVAAQTQVMAAGRWVCWEWEFDGSTNSAHVWIDSAAMTEIDAVGHGTQCQGPGFGAVPMSADYPWQGPELFDKVWIGWEQYQDAPASEVWIDDVVIGSERVGCP